VRSLTLAAPDSSAADYGPLVGRPEPLLAMSTYAEKRYVSHVQYETTSVLRPALTRCSCGGVAPCGMKWAGSRRRPRVGA